MLHVTNGDAAAEVMRKAGVAGEILPWRDVLHEGPVPAGLPLEALSEVRARFIAECGWATVEAAAEDFCKRDSRLAGFRDHEEVVLWFEHDLYDQLQLLQVLDWFSAREHGATVLSLICIDEYLGTLTPARMAALPREKVAVDSSHLRLAKQAWSAFCAPDPAAWAALRGEDTSALPFLAGAVLRHLEQYPSVVNGLNRTQAQILDAVRTGACSPAQVFAAARDAEERVFMGDSTLWLYMTAMFRGRPALLSTSSGAPFFLPGDGRPDADFYRQEILLTPAGESVLRGELDWVAANGIDKWLGGVHLETGRHWRWDTGSGLLVPMYAIEQ